MTSTSDSRTKVWLRKPIVRILAAFAVIIGPAAAIPLLIIGTASADQSPIGCYNGRDVVSTDIDGPNGTATVQLDDNPMTSNNNPQLCNTVALVAYYFKYNALANATDRYPQVEAAAKFYEVTSTDPTTISLPTDKCYAQLDLIYGIAGDGSSAVITELDKAEYATEGILINHEDFTPPADCTLPPTTTPPAPTCSTTTTVTVTPTTTDSTEPPTSTSVTPPECTTTVTSTPPPTSTPPTCSTTTTVTVTPTTTDSVPPSTTSVTPPECTTTVTSTPPTTTSSTPPTTSSTPPVTTSSVLPSSTSKAPTSTPSTTSTSPVFSTSVLPFSTSKAPVGTPPGTLPFTGANAPVKSGVLAALGLISVGGVLVLFAGRRRRAGGHRVG